MAIRSGNEYIILVETATPGVYVEVLDLTRVTRNLQGSANRTRTFRKTYVTRGQDTIGLTLVGLLNYTDPGQTILLNAELTNVAVRVRFSEAGSVDPAIATTLHCIVQSKTHEAAPDVGALQGITYELRRIQ